MEIEVGNSVIVRNLFSGKELRGVITVVGDNMIDVKTDSKNPMLKKMYFSTSMRGLGRFSMWMIEGIKK